MSDEEIAEAIELIKMATPARSYPGTGGLWFGQNRNLADASFDDWGLARAVAAIMNAIGDERVVIVSSETDPNLRRISYSDQESEAKKDG